MCRLFYILLFLSLCNLAGGVESQSSEVENAYSEQTILDAIDSSYILYDRNEFLVAAQYLEEFDPALIINDTLKLELDYTIMILYGHLQLSDKYFETIMKGLVLAHKLESRWMLLSFYRALGSFHVYEFEDYDRGLEYLKMALPYMDAVDSFSQTGLMMEIAASSLEAGLLDSAKQYYSYSFNLSPRDTTEHTAMRINIMDHDVYSFFIPYLIKTGQLDSAEYYLEKTSAFWKADGFQEGYIKNCVEWMEVKILQEDYEAALSYADIAIPIAEKLNLPRVLVDILGHQVKAQEKLKLKEESLLSYKKLHEFQLKVDTLESKQQLDAKRIQFIAQQYDTELTNIKTQNLQLEKGASQKQKIIFLIAGALLAIILFFGRALRRRRQNISKLSEVIQNSDKAQEKLRKEYNDAVQLLEKQQRQLTSVSLFLEKKNEALRSIRKMLANVTEDNTSATLATIRSVKKVTETSLKADDNWESFLYFFESIYPSFNKEIKSKYPSLNQNDMRILSFLKMGLTDKEAARLQSISPASFQKAKYRLKKKLHVDQVADIMTIVAEL